MRGYHATGALQALVTDVLAAGDAAGLPGDAKVFVADAQADRPTWHPWPAWSAQPEYGQTTLLAAAARVATRGARATVLITDNFADPFGAGGGTEGATESFYATLAELPLHRVWLAPTLARFDGRVDLALPPGDPAALQARILADTPAPLRAGGAVGLPQRMGGAGGFWKVPYRGRRGLAVYLMLGDPDDAPAFAHLRQALARRRPDWTPLLVRPLGADSVQLRPAQAPTPDPRAVRCDPNPAHAAGRPLTLQPDGRLTGAGADPRAAHTLTAWFELVAPAGHLSVSGDLGDCRRAAQVRVAQLAVQPALGFEGLAAPAGAVTAAVSPGPSLGPLAPDAGGPRAQALSLVVPPQLSPQADRRRVAQGLTGQVTVEVTLPAGALTLSRAVAERSFTTTPTDLARLYSPRDIVRALADGPVTVRVPLRLDPGIWSTPPPPAPTPEASVAPWALAAAAALLALLLALRPYGFVAELRVEGERYVHGVRVGGVLRRRPAVRLALPDGQAVAVSRPSDWRRQVALGDDATPLRRGQTVAVGAAKVRWLDRREVKAAVADQAYDPHAGG